MTPSVDPQPIILFVFFGLLICVGYLLLVGALLALLYGLKRPPKPVSKPFVIRDSKDPAFKNGTWYTMDELLAKLGGAK